MTKDITQKIKEFVEAEFKKPSCKYGYEPFPYHLVYVVKYALMLSNIHGGDKEVIELAAWLHDIGSAKMGRKDHHINGARIAVDKLTELGYPAIKIDKVRCCILNHRGSQESERLSIDVRIIADADAMSNFDNLSGLFKAAYVFEDLDQGEGAKSVMDKLERKWQKLHFLESKHIIRPKYEAYKTLLGE